MRSGQEVVEKRSDSGAAAAGSCGRHGATDCHSVLCFCLTPPPSQRHSQGFSPLTVDPAPPGNSIKPARSFFFFAGAKMQEERRRLLFETWGQEGGEECNLFFFFQKQFDSVVVAACDVLLHGRKIILTLT